MAMFFKTDAERWRVNHLIAQSVPFTAGLVDHIWAFVDTIEEGQKRVEESVRIGEKMPFFGARTLAKACAERGIAPAMRAMIDLAAPSYRLREPVLDELQNNVLPFMRPDKRPFQIR